MICSQKKFHFRFFSHTFVKFTHKRKRYLSCINKYILMFIIQKKFFSLSRIKEFYHFKFEHYSSKTVIIRYYLFPKSPVLKLFKEKYKYEAA